MGRPTFAPMIGPTGSPVVEITIDEDLNLQRDPTDPRKRLPGVPTYHCSVVCIDGVHGEADWVDHLGGWLWRTCDGVRIELPYPTPPKLGL